MDPWNNPEYIKWKDNFFPLWNSSDDHHLVSEVRKANADTLIAAYEIAFSGMAAHTLNPAAADSVGCWHFAAGLCLGALHALKPQAP